MGFVVSKKGLFRAGKPEILVHEPLFGHINR
jgi:hypothetical protein